MNAEQADRQAISTIRRALNSYEAGYRIWRESARIHSSVQAERTFQAELDKIKAARQWLQDQEDSL